MSLEYLTKGIPLFLRSASKDNTTVVLYTEDFGKVNLTIQSGQKVSSKLRPHVETAALVEVLYVQGKYFKRLIGAKRTKHYAAIWSDYNRLLAWKYFVEVFHQLVKIEYPDKQLYDLLAYSLELLNNYEYKKFVELQFILNILLYRFLVFLGQHSYSGLCQTCHSKMEGGFLSFQDGNIICVHCRGKRSDFENLKKIPKHVLDIFNQLSNQKELNITVTKEEKQSFINVMEFLIKYFIDYPHRLKDFEFLD